MCSTAGCTGTKNRPRRSSALCSLGRETVPSPLLHAGALASGAILIALATLLDGQLIAPFYDAQARSFRLRDAAALETLGHTGLKWLMVGFWLFCVVWGGALRRGAVYMALIVAAVVALKQYSPYSCPFDLPDYGGTRPLAGRCLPAAHPVIGFALAGLYLALRNRGERRAARHALAAALLIGMAAGAVQVARGAHFPSHVLWTAWVAWAVTLLLAALAALSEGRV
jgi:membrane-associated PAP2 superfamily phosphatase